MNVPLIHWVFIGQLYDVWSVFFLSAGVESLEKLLYEGFTVAICYFFSEINVKVLTKQFTIFQIFFSIIHKRSLREPFHRVYDLSIW